MEEAFLSISAMLDECILLVYYSIVFTQTIKDGELVVENIIVSPQHRVPIISFPDRFVKRTTELALLTR